MSELANLIEMLGEESTLKLVQAYGGTRVGVPNVMPKDHELRKLLGDSGFALLFQYFGGSEIAVPMARAWRFKVYEGRGLTPRKIALLCGCTESAFYSYRRRRGAENQMIFDFNQRR